MKIQVILGATRPGRISERVASWVVNTAAQNENFEVELVDMADYNLPHFNEPVSPRYNPNRQPEPEVARWLAKLAESDGYVVVTPEYNHSIAGVLKDGFDYVTTELARKPLTIVSHGTVGGARAAEQLKLIANESGAAVMPEHVALIGASAILAEDGTISDEAKNRPYGPQLALDNVLRSLEWWAETLKAGRDVAVASV